MNRKVWFALIATGLVLCAIVFSTRRTAVQESRAAATSPPAADLTIHAANRLSGRDATHGRDGGQMLSFAQLPSAHGRESVRRIAHDLYSWLVEPKQNNVTPEFVALDCESAPCILELDYDAAIGGDEFVERLIETMPTFSDLQGLEHEQLDHADSRRRVWLYWSPAGATHAAAIASARSRIADARASLLSPLAEVR